KRREKLRCFYRPSSMRLSLASKESPLGLGVNGVLKQVSRECAEAKQNGEFFGDHKTLLARNRQTTDKRRLRVSLFREPGILSSWSIRTRFILTLSRRKSWSRHSG